MRNASIIQCQMEDKGAFGHFGLDTIGNFAMDNNSSAVYCATTDFKPSLPWI